MIHIPTRELNVDFAVAGGGMAGICAAIAAARNGLRVALVQDRPMLGGNASSEIRMWVCGAHGKDSKEGGILEEILLENYYFNPTLRYTIWDDVLFTEIKREKNIVLLLNSSVESVETKNERILSMTAWNLTEYTRYKIFADYFCDCSGDGILRLSGAEYRMGREGRDEFEESHAPEKPDSKTMGNSILIQVRHVKKHIPFRAPEWAYHYTDETIPRGECMHNVKTNNFWWMEFGGIRDTIRDAGEIHDELLKIAYGVWEFIKNHPDGRGREWELDWIGKLPGKRESVRFTGDHMLCQKEIESGGNFPDIVCHGGWSMDNHHPEAFYFPGPPTIFHPVPSPFGIPYRSLYSKNISNLFFAGRNISCTHMGMSSTRVMATCATMGQAVGTAASIAKEFNLTPRGVYEKKIELLQDMLQDQDQYIPNRQRKVPEKILSAKMSHEVLRNGIDRSLGNDDNGVWLKPGESCSCVFQKPEKLSKVRIVFDSDFSDTKRMRECEGIPEYDPARELPPMLTRDFKLEILSDSIWREVRHIRENRKRLVKLEFEPENAAEAIRLTPLSVWSDDPEAKAHVFAFEAE